MEGAQRKHEGGNSLMEGCDPIRLLLVWKQNPYKESNAMGTSNSQFARVCNMFDQPLSCRISFSGNVKICLDQSHRCGHRQAACREPVRSYDKTTRTAICFEHKTQYLLIRAPYTRIVVFWHISKIPPMIGQSQISCNTPTFCIATIFVKYCYATGSWLL